ncbi:hypothetical protein [Bradyrhizobium sp. SSUT77]|uniref:hypothetical protein n=1 Tax=Bradyrhizobium sp. SSUT77 TaxID=3040603 RepID=UPI00244CDF35|nr:hypothetical protein [Bradyrhizobium sp. SSUT77]MDH2343233.1 hypothetical protein [Bradyrhizobium sp. SSUT77]
MTSLIEPTTIYHVAMGAATMNAVDANAAVSCHPREWSRVPWSPEVVERVEALIKRDEELNHVPVIGALQE